MAQLSDDCFAQGGRMMRTDEALDLLARGVVRVTESEPVALAAALGRILAEDVVSPHDVPPHDNSAVDGYAVFFDDLDLEADTVLPVVGRASAGHPLDGPARRGAAWCCSARSMTTPIITAGSSRPSPPCTRAARPWCSAALRGPSWTCPRS